jgi:hypothetical protein
MLAAASTPLMFSLIFVFAHIQADWDEPLILIARPMVASLTAVWLVSTTPYPDLFAPLSRVLPRGVGDSLFLTYRAVFALLARVERMWSALRSARGDATSRCASASACWARPWARSCSRASTAASGSTRRCSCAGTRGASAVAGTTSSSRRRTSGSWSPRSGGLGAIFVLGHLRPE